jgi:hypothetical protein
VAATRMIAAMGASFVALSVIALLAPVSLHMLLLGTGFGGLHMLFGFLIGRQGHERQI